MGQELPPGFPAPSNLQALSTKYYQSNMQKVHYGRDENHSEIADGCSELASRLRELGGCSVEAEYMIELANVLERVA